MEEGAMKTTKSSQISIRKYLLGELGENKRQALEQSLMTDESVFQELLILEDELVDEYLRGELNSPERKSFEAHFMASPERQQKLRFAKSFQSYLDLKQVEREPHRKPFWQSLWELLQTNGPVREWGLAAVLLLVIAGGSWMAIRIWRLQRQVEFSNLHPSPPTQTESLQKQLIEQIQQNRQLDSTLEKERQQRQQVEQELAGLKSPEKSGRLQPVLLSVALIPGMVRDLQGMQKVTIPPGAEMVQFKLNSITSTYAGYRAELVRVEGAEILTQTTPNVGKETDSYSLAVPVRLLAPGDYYFNLSGKTSNAEFEEVGKFYFKIVKK
jgi:hypothetical protein